MSDARISNPGQRRALSNVGGQIFTRGDRAHARVLHAALEGLEQEQVELLTHAFHTYTARLHPILCRRLLQQYARPGDVVLDPFCGGGTTVLEAMVRGCQAIGTDINPVALRIATVRTLVWSDARIDACVRALEALSDENFAAARKKVVPPLGPVARSHARWYLPHVLLELQGLHHRLSALEVPGQLEVANMVFSSMLVKLSLQRSDTDREQSDRQIGRGTASRLFGRKARELGERLKEVARAIPPGTPPPILKQADARDMPGPGSSVDLILTSPPYAGTYDYAAHQERRMGWLEEDDSFARTHEIGARRQQEDARQSWEDDEWRVLDEVARVLKPGGLAVLVVGDGVLEGAAYLEDEAIPKVAEEVGLRVVAIASQERAPTHASHVHAYAHRRRGEHLILLEKGD